MADIQISESNLWSLHIMSFAFFTFERKTCYILDQMKAGNGKLLLTIF